MSSVGCSTMPKRTRPITIPMRGNEDVEAYADSRVVRDYDPHEG